MSLDAASVLGAVAVGGDGSLLAALDSGIKQIAELVEGLQVLITGYKACNWEDRTTKQRLTLVPYPNRNLLADAYRTRLFAVFQPTTIAGMPAVREQSEPTSILCTITIGLSDSQGLELTYSQLEISGDEVADDLCGRGERIAEVVIGNLPPLR